MKKIVVFFILTFLSFSNELKILENDYKILEERFKEKELKKDLEFSELEFINLKKELLLKEIEIDRLKFNLVKKKNDIINDMDKYKSLKIYSQIKIEKLKKIIQQGEENSSNITKINLNKLKMELYEEEIKVFDYDYNYYYGFSQLNNLTNIEIDPVITSGLNFLLKKNNEILIDLNKSSLNAAKFNQSSQIDIKKLEIDLENAKYRADEELKNNNLETDKLRLSKDNLDNKLLIIQKKIDIAEENIELYKKQLSMGSITINDFIEKDLELINMKIEKLQTETNLKNISLDLELRIGKMNNNGVKDEKN